MLMVIFGAGASYDSSPTHPVQALFKDESRPPLAKDLFDDRGLFRQPLDDYPQCKPIVPRLRDPAVTSGEVSIEARLQEFQIQAKSYPRGSMELAAVRCYLQRAIMVSQQAWLNKTRGVTNYLTLLREIERLCWDGACLVTFNYDTLLEVALEELGHGIDVMQNYAAPERRFRVFKLHGSIDWGQEVSSPLPANLNRNNGRSILSHLVKNAADMEFSQNYLRCDPNHMGSVGGKPVFPAIAVPIQTKGTFYCPQVMVDQLTVELPKVDKILIIGWRGTEDHFLQLLRDNLSPGAFVSVVAGQQDYAEEICDRLRQALSSKGPSIRAESVGFTDYLRTGDAQSILNAPIDKGYGIVR